MRNFKVLAAKHAALVLVVGAGVLFTACQQRGRVVEKSPFTTNIVRLGDTVVAEVDGTNIYLSDVENAALTKGLIAAGTGITPSDPVFQSTLDELIDQRLLALEALRQSLDQNDEARRRVAAARERILSNVLVETLLNEKVTDEAVKRMYEAQISIQDRSEQVRARHILLETEEEANQLVELLESGGDFAALAKQMSKDRSTRDLGGDFGFFAKNSLAEGLSEIAFSLNTGDISAPVKTAQGWHVLKLEARRQTPQPKFEDIKAEIVSFMTYSEIEDLLKTLRAGSKINVKTGVETEPETPEDTTDPTAKQE